MLMLVCACLENFLLVMFLFFCFLYHFYYDLDGLYDAGYLTKVGFLHNR